MSISKTAIASSLALAACLVAIPIDGASAQGATGGWADIGPDGALGRSLNVVSANRVGTGVYEVKFNQDITNCAMNATLMGRGKKSITPGYIVVTAHNRNRNVVRVNTFLTTTLLPGDFRFDLVATC
jgi:hypothetical protein